jgi:hypothetical protein
MVTPRSGVDVEEFAYAIAGIALIFQLYQAVVADGGQETARGFLKLR